MFLIAFKKRIQWFREMPKCSPTLCGTEKEDFWGLLVSSLVSGSSERPCLEGMKWSMVE